MTVRRWCGLLVACVLVVAGCGGDDGDATSATDTGGGRIDETVESETDATDATDDTEGTDTDDGSDTDDVAVGLVLESTRPDIEAEARNVRLVRVSDAAMVLQFELAATGDEAIGTLDWELSDNNTDFEPVAVFLFDGPRSTVHSPALDAQERVLGTQLDEVEPGESRLMTIVYAAPPAEATNVLLFTSIFPATELLISTDASLLDDDPLVDRVGEITPAPDLDPQAISLAAATYEISAPSGVESVAFNLPGDVLFEFGQATLTPEAQVSISALVPSIPNQTSDILVVGHTDAVGDDASNQALSEQRAASVADALRPVLSSSVVFSTRGVGETQPIAPNENPDGSDNPDGRALNRRVTLVASYTAATPVTELAERRLTTEHADAGATLDVTDFRRSGKGYITARLDVSAPPAAQEISTLITEFNDIQFGLCNLSMLDRPNRFRVYPYTFYTGTGNDFCVSNPDGSAYLLPERSYFVAFPEPFPGVTAVVLEVPGFGLVDVAVEG